MAKFDMLLTQDQIDTYTASGHWKNRLLTDYLDDAVAARPDHVAAIDSAGQLTYAQLAEHVDTMAHALDAAGVGPGDVVGIQLPNWNEWVIIHLAALRLGAVTNPLIPIYRDREIGFMAEKAQVKVIFVPGDFRGYDYVAMVERLRDNLPHLTKTVVVRSEDTPDDTEFYVSWEELMATGRQQRESAPKDFTSQRLSPNDLALIMFTSGTTGSPKGVMHTQNSVLAAALPWPDKLGMDEHSVVHMASTFGHLTGYLFGVSLPIMLGGTGVFQDVWNPDEFARLTELHGIQHTSAATPFLHDVLQCDGIKHHDMSSLERFACMGAPIPRHYGVEAKEKLPNMVVFGGWGQTECGLSSFGHPNDPEEKIFSTDGRPLDGMDIRIVDFEDREVPPGTEGRIQIKGPFLFHGYLDELEMSRRQFDGTYFDTGDLGSIDEDGYLSLTGRTKDIIVRGGENIPVAYVENVLYEHPDIDALAVVASPHERLQETAALVVVMADGAEPLTLERMREYLQAKGVAKQYWPEKVVVTDDLPRTPSGKIQKFVLRQQLLEAADSQNKP